MFSISQNFLRDLLREAKKINDVSEDKLIEYTDTMVSERRRDSWNKDPQISFKVEKSTKKPSTFAIGNFKIP